MADLPTIVYRCPGPYQRKGGTWGYHGAETEDQLAALLAAGWFPTLDEAIAAFDGTAAAPQKPTDKAQTKKLK